MDPSKMAPPAEHPPISIYPSAPPLPSAPPYSENDAENGVGQFATPQPQMGATYNHPITIMPAQTYQPGPHLWRSQQNKEAKKWAKIVGVPCLIFFIVFPIALFGFIIFRVIQLESRAPHKF